MLWGDHARIHDQIARYRDRDIGSFVLMCPAPFDVGQLRAFDTEVISRPA